MLPKRKILITAALRAGLANAPAPGADGPPTPIGITPPQTKDKFTIDVMRASIRDAAALLDNGQLACKDSPAFLPNSQALIFNVAISLP